ncbi:hypothetical protein TNIN_153701 [Trichonephila inaurata madagascariensis]|uniref:Uncharacterized protein n=1 Tax=Trichonephila inaurata madagascariensis TaxID=2747483 RepID=A0A8X7C862_9ARAC|nr:hypothetical protein TNIN_153701 [Trichonephila inaurata madagascariensis]
MVFYGGAGAQGVREDVTPQITLVIRRISPELLFLLQDSRPKAKKPCIVSVPLHVSRFAKGSLDICRHDYRTNSKSN